MLLDIRPREVFQARHLAGAASHPLLDGDWADTVPSLVLPPRHEPLLVLGRPGQPVTELAAHLQQRGRAPVTGLALDEEAWAQLPADWCASGPSGRHLWSAPPWLLEHIDLLPPPAAGPVLDLGCGSGRAAVYLAERGYRLTGLDWQPEALAMGNRLAGWRQVEARFLEADLRRVENVPPGPWSIICNFRFLQRELLENLHRWLRPGGLALVRTFRHAPGYQGHPHRRHRLSPGELLDFLPPRALLHPLPRGRFRPRWPSRCRHRGAADRLTPLDQQGAASV